MIEKALGDSENILQLSTSTAALRTTSTVLLSTRTRQCIGGQPQFMIVAALVNAGGSPFVSDSSLEVITSRRECTKEVTCVWA